MSLKKVVIVGYDAVSPLGTDLDDQWQKAIDGISGIGDLTRFAVPKDFPVKYAGQVDAFDESKYPFLRPREMVHWKSPIFKHAMLVVHRALQNSGIEISKDLSPRVATTFSSAVGGQDAVLNADRLMISKGSLPHPFTNPNSCINMVGGKVSILTNATGPIVSTITACATGVTSMIIGSMLINQNKADVVIAGAVDFALVEPIVAGFATMNGAFCPKPAKASNDERDSSKCASRPFSIDRRGFIISEGAGAIIITSKEFADVHGLKYDVELLGSAMTSDAKHFVAPNFETVTKCIDGAIYDAGIKSNDINSINAHAASTKVGDRVEYEALKTIFKDQIPPVSANKSLIGHAMGASSAIESIFAIKGMINEILPPTINYMPDPEIEIDCVANKKRKVAQEFVLKNSFGFGGCNSCVIFKRI